MSLSRNVAVASAALLLFSSAACKADPAPPIAPTTAAAIPLMSVPAPGDTNVDFDYGGKARSFLVHAPADYTTGTTLPLVVVMHYYPGDSRGIAATSDMSAKADKEKFLVVYPQGFGGGYNALICCGSEDDVTFIKRIVDHMVLTWKADPKRVYATGISNGGDMSFKLAIELPNTFAAVAPVSGGFAGPKSTDPAYKPSSPVSVITFLGLLDRFFGTFETGITQWNTKLGCPAGTPHTVLKDITLSTVKCADGSDFQVYRLAQMGHSWPGAKVGGLTFPDSAINATDLMWEFFKAHKLP